MLPTTHNQHCLNRPLVVSSLLNPQPTSDYTLCFNQNQNHLHYFQTKLANHHADAHRHRFPCLFAACKKKFSGEHTLRRHMMKQHLSDPVYSLSFPCDTDNPRMKERCGHRCGCLRTSNYFLSYESHFINEKKIHVAVIPIPAIRLLHEISKTEHPNCTCSDRIPILQPHQHNGILSSSCLMIKPSLQLSSYYNNPSPYFQFGEDNSLSYGSYAQLAGQSTNLVAPPSNIINMIPPANPNAPPLLSNSNNNNQTSMSHGWSGQTTVSSTTTNVIHHPGPYQQQMLVPFHSPSIHLTTMIFSPSPTPPDANKMGSHYSANSFISSVPSIFSTKAVDSPHHPSPVIRLQTFPLMIHTSSSNQNENEKAKKIQTESHPKDSEAAFPEDLSDHFSPSELEDDKELEDPYDRKVEDSPSTLEENKVHQKHNQSRRERKSTAGRRRRRRGLGLGSKKNKRRRHALLTQEPARSPAEGEAVYYEIEKILDMRKIGPAYEYLIAWKGYNSDHNTWEPESHIQTKEIVNEFKSRRSSASSKKSNSIHPPPYHLDNDYDSEEQSLDKRSLSLDHPRSTDQQADQLIADNLLALKDQI